MADSKRRFTVETERESDKRWIAEITDIPGVMAYGKTEIEAIGKAVKIALDVEPEPSETIRTTAGGK